MPSMERAERRIRSKAAAMVVSGALIGAILLSGCQARSPVPATHYAAAISGSRALIGVVVAGKSVTAYVCDGTDKQFARVLEWFNGSLEGNSFELTSKMGAHLMGTVSAGAVQGSFVSGDGLSLAYRAAEVEADAGLFDSTIFSSGTKYVAAWIVLPDGQQRGAVGGDPTGGGGTLAIMPVPVPRLPASMRVTTEFGTFAVRRMGGG